MAASEASFWSLPQGGPRGKNQARLLNTYKSSQPLEDIFFTGHARVGT
jgi:hypothetical protein